MNSDLSGLKPIHRSRLLVIRSLIEGYDGVIPFHQYLKNNFSKNRNFGSSDRRITRAWCYAWFRLGKAIPEVDFFSRLVIGYYLVNGLKDEFSSAVAEVFFQKKLSVESYSTLQSRLDFCKRIFPEFKIADLFPFEITLSNGISREQVAVSMLTQPKVFIRIIPGKVEIVKMECEKFSIPYEEIIDLPGSLAFEASVKLDMLTSREKGFFEIQDLSSQITGYAIPALPGQSWWDCCCGAGGKSLQVLQSVEEIKLTASDIRTSILENFVKRLSKTNESKVRLMELDLLNDELPSETFDGVIADVPCTGSGTWARSPEKLRYFKTSEIEVYNSRQKAIISKVVNRLKPGGMLVYITCSIFNAENEEVALWINSLTGFQLIEQKAVLGIDSHSDSMFYAVFKKSV